MAGFVPPINSLPNEILLQILNLFPTRTLLPLALIDRRFQATVTRLVQYRLLQTADLGDSEVLLECYHPSAKLSAPTICCRHMEISFLDRAKSVGSLGFGQLSGLYSRYRPVLSGGSTWPQWTEPIIPQGVQAPTGFEGDTLVTHDLYLDECELFSQLCTSTSIVKRGPRPGLYLRHTGMTDGLIRVWRQWLARAEEADKCRVAPSSSVHAKEGPCQQGDGERILWADASKNVGLKFRVSKVNVERMPILYGSGEDPPVAYKLQYEELLVRTNQVLLASERSFVPELVHSGYAMKFDGKKAYPVKMVVWPTAPSFWPRSVAVM